MSRSLRSAIISHIFLGSLQTPVRSRSSDVSALPRRGG